jgi:LmbE family N-acetylglucosaminyl deacetylase
MNAVLDLLVLSPHLDDAVLSCGGRLAAATRARQAVSVVTVFAADEPIEAPNPLAGKLRRIWSLPPGEVVAARRAEDLEACRRLGVTALHWDFAEALYRTTTLGEPLYPSAAALYGDVAIDDRPLKAEISRRIRALPETRLLLVPLGVGGHVDHLLVRSAAAAAGRSFACYEEFPYVEWKRVALDRALDDRRQWEPSIALLDDELLDLRAEAILAYRSQIPALFRTAGRLRKQLRRAARRAGGERIWKPKSPPDESPR